MTKTFISNPVARINRNGKGYLLFDLYIGDDRGHFILIKNCLARRLVNGVLAVRGPFHPGKKPDVELSLKFRQLIAERIEEKWGDSVRAKSAFTIY